MSKEIHFEKIEPFFTPFGMGGGNEVYHIGKSYFSYKANPNDNLIDRMFGVDTGEETVFYSSKDDSFIILLGDFRKKIVKEDIRTHRQAIDFCKKHKNKWGQMTTYE